MARTHQQAMKNELKMAKKNNVSSSEAVNEMKTETVSLFSQGWSMAGRNTIFTVCCSIFAGELECGCAARTRICSSSHSAKQLYQVSVLAEENWTPVNGPK